MQITGSEKAAASEVATSVRAQLLSGLRKTATWVVQTGVKQALQTTKGIIEKLIRRAVDTAVTVVVVGLFAWAGLAVAAPVEEGQNKIQAALEVPGEVFTAMNDGLTELRTIRILLEERNNELNQ